VTVYRRALLFVCSLYMALDSYHQRAWRHRTWRHASCLSRDSFQRQFGDSSDTVFERLDYCGLWP